MVAVDGQNNVHSKDGNDDGSGKSVNSRANLCVADLAREQELCPCHSTPPAGCCTTRGGKVNEFYSKLIYLKLQYIMNIFNVLPDGSEYESSYIKSEYISSRLVNQRSGQRKSPNGQANHYSYVDHPLNAIPVVVLT